MPAPRHADRGRTVLRTAGAVACAFLLASGPGVATASSAGALNIFDTSARPIDSIGAHVIGFSAATFSSGVIAPSANPALAMPSDSLRRVAGPEARQLGGAQASAGASSVVSASVFAGEAPPSIDAPADDSVADANESAPGSIAGLAFDVSSMRSAAADAGADQQTANGIANLFPGVAKPLFAFANTPAASGVSVNQQLDSIALGDSSAGLLLSTGGDVPLKSSPLSPLAGGITPASAFAQSTVHGPAVQLELPLTLGNVDARLSLTGRSEVDTNPSGFLPGAFGAPAVAGLSSQTESLRGGVTVGVPIFKRQAEVSLDGVFSRLVNVSGQPINDGSAPPPALGLYGTSNVPASSALAGLSAYQNLSTGRQYVGAYSVALPIGKALTANMQYVDQRFGGDALSSTNTGVNLQKTSSTLGVLYKIPNTNAAINLNFNQSTFENDQLPGYNWVQNRQNLFFTVKF